MDYRQQGQGQFFPGMPGGGFPGGGNVERRLERFERELRMLERRVERIERRLGFGGGYGGGMPGGYPGRPEYEIYY